MLYLEVITTTCYCAEYMLKTLGYVLPTGTCLIDISERSHRCLKLPLISFQ